MRDNLGSFSPPNNRVNEVHLIETIHKIGDLLEITRVNCDIIHRLISGQRVPRLAGIFAAGGGRIRKTGNPGRSGQCRFPE